ncbi:reductase [Fusarium beomiforme]|uniref:Reductase n=1 Tax=Fusarium beomiforme TaxID=44412 RepID=A0A9P5AAJ4_9HYPO|nr:reductase [Fusarium beomiforme]
MNPRNSTKQNPYALKFVNRLPPGTDEPEQLRENPRLPRSCPSVDQPFPDWPPPQERSGKWISKYLDQLDPEIHYDQIIRTAGLFYGSDFSTALGYAAVFCMLTQTPAGAVATHGGGKIIRRGHQRYYETQLMNLHWMFYGSSAPETIKYINQVNKIHSAIWKRFPGTYSFPWEAQMAIIGLSYFETWVRKTVGARVAEAHPRIQEAYPAWGESLTAHFVTEPTDGTRSMGINYPRDWSEAVKFFYWFDDFPYEDQTTPEQRQQGHETAEAFIAQFCDLWFPGPLKVIGRHVLLTFIPPGCRRRQQLGEPNRVISGLTKLTLKVGIDIQDAFGSDPIEPPMVAFRDMLLNKDLTKVDQEVKEGRDWRSKIIVCVLCGSMFVALAVKLSEKRIE